MFKGSVQETRLICVTASCVSMPEGVARGTVKVMKTLFQLIGERFSSRCSSVLVERARSGSEQTFEIA